MGFRTKRTTDGVGVALEFQIKTERSTQEREVMKQAIRPRATQLSRQNKKSFERAKVTSQARSGTNSGVLLGDV